MDISVNFTLNTVDIATTILRVLVGLLFMGHGSQKLFGWFKGGGLNGTAMMMERGKVHPPRVWAIVAGLGELLGGASIALGFLTPLGALAVTAVMVVAIAVVHLPHGIWNIDGGFEYNLVMIGVAMWLLASGPGKFALDTALGIRLPSVVIAVATVLTLLSVGAALASTQPLQLPKFVQRLRPR